MYPDPMSPVHAPGNKVFAAPRLDAAGGDWASNTEQAVLEKAQDLGGSMGWTQDLVNAAGERAGLSRSEIDLLFPRGAEDLAALLSGNDDAAAAEPTEAEFASFSEQMEIKIQVRSFLCD